METTTTEPTASTAEGAGNEVTAVGEGAVTQTATTEETPKTFTQSELDQIIKARLAEHGRTLKTKHEKELEAKLAETRDATQADLDKLVDERVTARLAETALNTARAAVAVEYGLNEDQAALLQGDTPEALTQHADKVFGALKQLPKPPIIKTGQGTAGPQSPSDISKMSPAEIRANKDTLWKAVRA